MVITIYGGCTRYISANASGAVLAGFAGIAAFAAIVRIVVGIDCFAIAGNGGTAV